MKMAYTTYLLGTSPWFTDGAEFMRIRQSIELVVGAAPMRLVRPEELPGLLQNILDEAGMSGRVSSVVKDSPLARKCFVLVIDDADFETAQAFTAIATLGDTRVLARILANTRNRLVVNGTDIQVNKGRATGYFKTKP